jgi:hypothetical protein
MTKFPNLREGNYGITKLDGINGIFKGKAGGGFVRRTEEGKAEKLREAEKVLTELRNLDMRNIKADEGEILDGINMINGIGEGRLN